MKKHLGPDNLEFTLKPSQWVTVGWILMAFSIVWFGPVTAVISGLFGIIWLCKRLIISCWRYDFHERTITEKKGVFTIRKQEIHYFRIKSIRVIQPFFYRFVGLVSYDLITSDPLIPVLRLYAVADDGIELRDILKKKATYWRKEMGVKETDFHNF